MCAIGGPVYVCYGWPCICVIWVALYMCAMGGSVYVCYGWPCICVLWVALYLCAMGGPVYVCHSLHIQATLAYIYRATHNIHIQGHP
jgi:hypothetical protein